MSRTIRRKNYEAENRSSWNNKGRKIARAYTESDLDCFYNSDGLWVCTYTYREPTKNEYFNKYWSYHSDKQSRYFRKGPNKWYRFFTIHQYRMQDKTELRKFMKNEDYEPMCRDRISSGYWD